MRVLLIFIFTWLLLGSKAQKNTEFSRIDKIMLQIPEPMTHSTKGIADYINSNFTNQSEKARAAFIWVASNIQYDIENMFALNNYQNSKELIDKVLRTRKGVCMHFAELFNEIADLVGLKTYVISGYTKQDGSIANLSHAWCAGFIDSAWYLFDPTWGSGYVQNYKYVREINNFYFKAEPDQLIKSHMPFDPLWQFSNYPLTNQEFYEGKSPDSKNRPFFNFPDTLAAYENESELERLISASRRIEKNGVKNSMISDELKSNKQEIEYHNNSIAVDTHNAAVNFYNEGIYGLNKFIDYRNKQFTPQKSENEIRKMLETTENSLILAKDKTKEIKTPDSKIRSSMVQLGRMIDEAIVNLNEQKAFVEKYFNTGKMFRKSLFYKHTWMGIPLN